MKDCTFQPETGRTKTKKLLSDILEYSLETDLYPTGAPGI